MPSKYEVATFGAGCFWCIEAVFQRLRGVEQVVSGYAGGQIEHPSYERVCSGTTGHAEVVQISYDPTIITFVDLLEVFWHIHDPTSLNRQGADVGTQYRSAIFYHTEEQKAAAEKSKHEAEASGNWSKPIVTEITPFTCFYEAEPYHQDYYRLNPNQGYCRLVIDPKIRKFQKQYEEKLR
ncbi:MAG: peptide-methionine (S)-S-oxide reductase MsrA [Anaerolineae bacterium]|nr:peptide-methionine (S)-S-oxide reductase MsrA [Anaerolineae bacterium]